MVFCQIERDENEYEPDVGRRVETDCGAHGAALGVPETSHETSSGQVVFACAGGTRCVDGANGGQCVQ